MEDPAARAREELMIGSEGQVGRPQRRQRRRSAENLWVVLLLVLSLAGVWLTLQNRSDAAATDPARQVQRGEVQGVSGLSMARAVNLREALDRTAAAAPDGDRVVALHVSPGAARTTMITPEGDEYFLTATAGSDEITHLEFARTRRASAGLLSAVEPAAVERAVKTVARRNGIAESDFAYLVLTAPGADQTWFVRFESTQAGTRDWIGRGDGTQLRPTSTPGVSSGELAICLREAIGNAEAIQRCLR